MSDDDLIEIVDDDNSPVTPVAPPANTNPTGDGSIEIVDDEIDTPIKPTAPTTPPPPAQPTTPDYGDAELTDDELTATPPPEPPKPVEEYDGEIIEIVDED